LPIAERFLVCVKEEGVRRNGRSVLPVLPPQP